MMRWLLAVLSGLLYWAGFVSYVHGAIAWIALVPLLLALGGVSPKKGLFLAWTSGLIAHLAGFYWVIHTMLVFGELPLPLALLGHIFLALAQSGQFALFGWAFVAMRRKSGWSSFLLVPIAWVMSEFLSPQLFPSYFANSQFYWNEIIQIADITGVLGISTMLACSNGAVADLVMVRVREKRWKLTPAAFALSIIIAAFLYGKIRIPMIEKRALAAPMIKVALIQENIGLAEKDEDPVGVRRRYIESSQNVEQRDHPDLIVWPETAMPWPAFPDDVRQIPEGVLNSFSTPLLTGLYLQGEGTYNAAALIDASKKVLGSYRKQILLMFGEYFPLGEAFPVLYDWFANVGHFIPGKKSNIVPFEQWRLGVTLCYEGILPRLVQKIMQQEPHLFVNLTNDSWFGDTHEPEIHLALQTFRVIEHRRALVRATNTGISALVDPVGRVVQKTETFEEAVLVGSVPLLSGRTFYGVFGDWIGWLCLFFSFYLLFLRRCQH